VDRGLKLEVDANLVHEVAVQHLVDERVRADLVRLSALH
jgi:hypothetical protein